MDVNTDTMARIFSLISTAFTEILGWIGDVGMALFSDSGELAVYLPFVIISIAISAVLFGFVGIKKLVWGK